MKMSVKRVVTTVLLVAVLLSSFAFAVPASASDNERTMVSPRWVGISSVNVELTFSATGSAVGTLTKNSSASLMEATLTVYRQSGSQWVFVDSVSGSKTRGVLALGVDFDAVAGTRYKAVFDVTVYTNNVPEHDSVTVEKTC